MSTKEINIVVTAVKSLTSEGKEAFLYWLGLNAFSNIVFALTVLGIVGMIIYAINKFHVDMYELRTFKTKIKQVCSEYHRYNDEHEYMVQCAQLGNNIKKKQLAGLQKEEYKKEVMT